MTNGPNLSIAGVFTHHFHSELCRITGRLGSVNIILALSITKPNKVSLEAIKLIPEKIRWPKFERCPPAFDMKFARAHDNRGK